MTATNARHRPGLMQRLAAVTRQTPGRYWLMYAVIVVTALAAFLAQRSAIAETRATLQTITKDSTPSIIAAQELRYGFHRLNGDVIAMDLGRQYGIPVRFDLDADRHAIAEQLVVAAKNITYGDAEAIPIRTMIEQLPIYTEMTAPSATEDGPKAATELHAASRLLHADLVGSAQKLDDVNRQHLNDAYDGAQGGLAWAAAITLVTGLALVAALVVVQVRIAKATHRYINLPLAGASVAAVLLLLQGILFLRDEREQIRAAKKDAFDSVGYLSQARANAEDARSEELLALVAGNSSDGDWRDYAEQMHSLVATDSAEEIARTYATGNNPTFKGLLGEELRNVTYEGEQDAANAELHAYGDFLKAVQAQRNLAAAGNLDGAVRAAIGQGGGGASTEAVQQVLDAAIAKTYRINTDWFGKIRDQAFAALELPTIALPLLFLAIVGLSALGIRQRVAEYTLA